MHSDRNFCVWLLTVVVVVLLSSSVCGAEDPKPAEADVSARLSALEKHVADLKKGGLFVQFKNGLVVTDPSNKAFKFNLGGRLHVDFGFFRHGDRIQNAFGNFQDGAEFRRARLGISGSLNEIYEYKAEFDFAPGTTTLADAYLGMMQVPVVGTIRVGHQFEPFGLEEQTSSKYISTIERSLTSVFSPKRNTGIRFANATCNDHVTWAVGAFRTTNNQGRATGDGAYNFTGRVTAAPVLSDDGRQVLHGGVAISRSNPNDDEVAFMSRPETNLAPVLVDTGTIMNAEDVTLVGLESAVVLGPFSVQGEYMESHVHRDRGLDDAMFSAAYVFVSYFVTGEHRVYSRTTGVFDRVTPKANFRDGKGGAGAIELVARVSTVDLDNEGINGSDMDNVTLGTNWYLNSNMRVMCNYVNVDHELGRVHEFLVRFGLEF
ncbi:MAG: OprO/OprP family phosphate-selective porin [Planctomycetota bacterium]